MRMLPNIGDIVLFKIDSSDFGIHRPFLVTFVHDNGAVDGEVFFHWEKDKGREWPQKHLFWRLSNTQRTVEIFGVKAGEAVGEYKLRPQQGESSFYKDITDRFLKLEEQLKLSPASVPSRALVPEKRGK